MRKKNIEMITPPGSPDNTLEPILKENLEKLEKAQFKISHPSLMGVIPIDITYKETFLDQTLTGIVKYSPYLTDIGNFKAGHAFKNNAMLVDNPLRVNQILTISVIGEVCCCNLGRGSYDENGGFQFRKRTLDFQKFFNLQNKE